jgi:hypothetical protein
VARADRVGGVGTVDRSDRSTSEIGSGAVSSSRVVSGRVGYVGGCS